MNPIEKLQSAIPSLTKKETQIANYILKHPICVIQETVEDISKNTLTSKSAYIRMCQKIGYDGYSEFKFALSRYLISNESLNKTTATNSITSITSNYAQHVMQIAQMIKIEEVQELVNLMIKAKRIKIFGYNRTGLAAKQLRMRMSKIGYDSEAINDQVIMRDVSVSLTKDDLCIIFSIKAMTTIYSTVVKQLKMNQCPTVLITMSPKNALKKDVMSMFTLPFISRFSSTTFLDDQAILFVFIEILLSELAKYTKPK